MIETVRRMVTSCPECDTHFYVKPDQLAARKGFVRCGHCQHRFNALEFMLPERELQIDFSSLDKVRKSVDKTAHTANNTSPLETLAEATHTSLADAITSMPLKLSDMVMEPNLEGAHELPAEVAVVEFNEAAEVNEKAAVLATEVVAATEQPRANSEESLPVASQANPELVKDALEQAQQVNDNRLQTEPALETPRQPDTLTPEPAVLPVPDSLPLSAKTNLLEIMQDHYQALQVDNAEQVLPLSAVQPIKAPEVIAATHTDFAKKESLKHSKPKSLAISITLGLLITLFTLLAVLQTLYYYRTAITSQLPQIKPYFEQACLATGCVIELPKEISKINIDDSDLKEDATYQGLIRVSATVINQAAVNLAYPNLELTLTDEDNKPLLRRIFKPKEYLDQKISIEDGLPSNQETYVNLNVSAVGSAVVGYRLLPTYD